MSSRIPKKISLVPKKHHGFQFVIFLLGCLLPPLAVALRFGLGVDLLINIILCICGYFPCHFHNFYIQNIRNNTNRSRTPKWALKAGLVDNRDQERRANRSQWAKHYDERNLESTHVGQALEEGEEGTDYVPVSEQERERAARGRNEGLWTNDDEEFYNEDRAKNQQRWHYPANFEGTVGDGRSSRPTKASSASDRWERSAARRNSGASSSNDSYPPAASADNDVPEWGKDYGKRRSTKNTAAGPAVGAGGGGGKGGWASNGGFTQDSHDYGRTSNGNAQSGRGQSGNAKPAAARPDDVFNHEF